MTEYQRALSAAKLPCDVKIGHITFRAGVAMTTLVTAATAWFELSKHSSLSHAEQSHIRRKAAETVAGGGC